MANGLDIGRAGFSLGVSAADAVKGVTDFTNTTSRQMTRMVPSFQKVDAGFGSIDESISKVQRGFDRYTRGLRGLDPVMASAREQLYRVEDAHRRVSREVDIAKERLKEKQAMEQSNIASMQRLTDKLNQQDQALAEAAQKMNLAGLELDRLKNSTTANAESVAKQNELLDAARIKYDSYNAKVAELAAKIDVAKLKEDGFAHALTQQYLKVEQASDSIQSYNTQIAKHNDQIRILEAQQANTTATQIAAASTITKLEASYKNFADQAQVATVRLKQMEERNVSAELQKQNAQVRLLSEAYEKANGSANKLQGQLSAMSRAGQKNTQAYTELATKTRIARAEADKLFQSKEIGKATVMKLRIEEKNYTKILDEQKSMVDLLNAKAGQERTSMMKAQGDLQVTKQRHLAITTSIQGHKDALESLNTKMAQSKIQLQQETQQIKVLQAQQQQAIVSRERMQAELTQQQVKQRQLKAAYEAEETALKALIYTGQASQKEIDAQQAKVDALTKAYKREGDALASTERQMNEHVVRQQRLAKERASQELNIKSLIDSEKRYEAQMEVQKQRIDTLNEKMQAKKAKQDQLAESSNKITAATARQNQAMAQTASGFSAGAAGAGQMGSAYHRLTSIQAAVNAGMMRTNTIIRDLLVGSISGFIGNTLSGLIFRMGNWAETGLKAYTSHEMLSKSLTALSAREMVATGQFQNLTLAEGAAGEKAEGLIKWMEKLATQSPFSVDDISGAFRLGNALGFTSSQAQRLIRDTVDWATATGGTGESINSVIRALGQMNSTGHVTLEDLNQMTDAGLGARDVLRNAFAPEIKASGKSLEDLISSGLIPADRAITALAEAMETDFGGAAAKAGGSMTGLLNSLMDLKASGLRELMTGMFKAIQGPLEAFVGFLQQPSTIGIIQEIGNLLGGVLGQALAYLSSTALPAAIRMFRTFGPSVANAFSFIAAIASEAWEWGYSIGSMLAEGLSDTLDMIVGVITMIGNVIGDWMEPHSPPKFLPHIIDWGRAVGQLYFGGMTSFDPRALFDKWTDGDFGIVDKVKSQLNDALSGLIDVGMLDQSSAISIMFGTDQEMTSAINEFKRIGQVSEETFERIRVAAGPAGNQMVEYAKAIFNSQGATDALAKAQARLDQITKAYDAKLTPLRAKLQALQDQETKAARDAERKQLTDLLSYASQSPDSGIDVAGIQKDLAKMDLEDQIAAEEKARDAAIAAQQAKVDAALSQAEAAAKELALLESVLAVQKEQMDMAKQRDAQANEQRKRDQEAREQYAFDQMTDKEKLAYLEARQKGELEGSEAWIQTQRQIDQMKDNTANDQAKRDAEAKERYRFEHMTQEQQLAYLQEKQKAERVESENWFAIQDQIEAKQEEIKRASEESKKSAGSAAKEATNYEDAYNRSVGETADRLAEVQRQLALAEPGTKEYFALKKEEQKLQAQLNKENEKAVESVQAQEEADFDHKLAMSEKSDAVDLLRQRMAELDPASEEYRKRAVQLKKAEEDQAKATEQLSNAEFEAKFAAQDRAGKIAMLQERLGGLNEGSLEYEKTLKRLNTLEVSAAGGGGGGKGKGKGKPGGIEGGAFKGLDDVKEKMDDVSEAGGRVMAKIESLKMSFVNFKTRLDPIFAWLREHSGIVAFVLQKLAMGFVIGLAIEKVIRPIFMLIGGLRFLLTWSNLLFASLTFLGYAWKNNLGGLRDIVGDVWGKIQAPLEGLFNIFERIRVAFETKGFSAAIDVFMKSLGGIGASIGDIGSTIFAGIAEWTAPFIDMLTSVFNDVVAWAQSGGPATLLDAIGEAIAGVFENMGSGDGTILAGLFGLVGGIGLVLHIFITEIGERLLLALPELVESVEGVFKSISDWLHANGRALMHGIGVSLGLAIAGLGEFIVPVFFELLHKLFDLGMVILPMIPDALSAIVTFLATVATWLVARGVPLLVSKGIAMFTEWFNKIGAMLPTLAQSLGRLIGSTVSKIVVVVVAGLASIALQLFQSSQNGTLWPAILGFFASIGNVVVGALKGVVGLLVGIVEGVIEPFRDAGDALIAAMSEGIDTAWVSFYTNTLALFDGWMNGILAQFGIGSSEGGGGSGWGQGVGKSITDGIWAGLQNVIQMGLNYLSLLGTSLIAPVITAISAWILNLWTKFVNFHLTIIRAGVKFVDDTVNAWTDLITRVVTLVTDFLDRVWSLFDGGRTSITTSVSGLKNESLGIFSEMDAAIRAKISQLTSWLQSIFNTAKTNVVTAVTGLKTSAIGQIQALYTSASNITTATKEALNRIWSNIRDNALTMWAGIKSTARSAFEGVVDLIGSIGDSVKSTLASKWEDVKSGAKSMLSGAADSAKEGFAVVVGHIRGIADDVYDMLFGSNGVMGRIKSKMGDIWGDVASAAKSAFSGIGGSIKGVINEVIRQVNKAIQAINDVADSLGLDRLEKIPELALGTKYFQGGFAMVGENGPELAWMPRGAEVTPASRTMAIFEDAAKTLIAQVMDVVAKASMSMQEGAAELVQALREAAAINNTGVRTEREVIVQNTVESKVERHDHWNMTVNTQATQPSIEHDYRTMQAIAGV